MTVVVEASNQPPMRLVANRPQSSKAEVSTRQREVRHVVALSRLQYELMRVLMPIQQVDALYAETDDEGVLMVFVVVPQHDDATYDAVIAAEDVVRSRTAERFELRLRAHQNRDTRCAVPMRSIPLFLR